MKILMISQMVPYLPCYDGFRIIPANLLRRLSSNHEIHLVAFSSGNETEQQLKWPLSYCSSVKVLKAVKPGGLINRLTGIGNPYPADLLRALAVEVDRVKPDILHLEGPRTASLSVLAPQGAISILSAHDSLYLRYQDFARFSKTLRDRCLNSLRAMTLKRYEKRWYGTADRVVVTSSMDMDALSKFVPLEKLTTIANGVDFDRLSYEPNPMPCRLVFTGNMSWLPNVDAVEYFVKDIFPKVRERFSNAEFWIVGSDPSPSVRALEKVEGVHVTGTVPDIRDWVWKASIYVSSLRYGAGCKNKILEAMSLGVPIVATSRSLTGTPIKSGYHLLKADDTEDFIGAVCRLLDNPSLCRELSLRARSLVEQDYSWDGVAAKFEKLYRRARSKTNLICIDGKAVKSDVSTSNA